MLASRLASCAATKASVARPSRAFAVLVSTSSGVSKPSTVESREASALASALPQISRRGLRAINSPTLEAIASPVAFFCCPAQGPKILKDPRFKIKRRDK